MWHCNGDYYVGTWKNNLYDGMGMYVKGSQTFPISYLNSRQTNLVPRIFYLKVKRQPRLESYNFQLMVIDTRVNLSRGREKARAYFIT